MQVVGIHVAVLLSSFLSASAAPCGSGGSCTPQAFGTCDLWGCRDSGTISGRYCAKIGRQKVGHSCDDRLACTRSDKCDSNGKCVGTNTCPVSPCMLRNDCTASGCKPVWKATGAACTANPCTLPGKCKADHTCVPGAPMPLSSCPAKQCKKATGCDPKTGCTYGNAPNGGICDDGVKCTGPDTCVAGACVGPPRCPVTQCHTKNNCNSRTGLCVNTIYKLPSSSCTLPDKCVTKAQCDGRGHCVAKEVKKCPASTDPCKTNVCNPATGACGLVNKPDKTSCTDGGVCTASGECQAGICKTALKTCPDSGTPCYLNRCDFNFGSGTGKCIQVNSGNGIDCNDGNLCTVRDACLNGKCAGVPTFCQDMNEDDCEYPACDPKTGLCSVKKFLPDGSTCAGSDFCLVNATCTAGKCSGKERCTPGPADQCSKPTGCSSQFRKCIYTNVANGTSCNDGNLCTLGDACDGTGKCVSGQQKDCGPPQKCKTPSCDPATGECKFDNKPDGTTCDDGKACTLDDKCNAGVCVGTWNDCGLPGGNPCDGPSCDEGAGGVCISGSLFEGAPCDPNGGTCAAGNCTAPTP